MTCVHIIGITIRHVGVSDIPAAAASTAAFIIIHTFKHTYIQYTHTHTSIHIHNK